MSDSTIVNKYIKPFKTKPKMSKLGSKDNLIGHLLILPFYIFLFLFILVPIITNIVLSFTNYNLRSMEFVGFRNYIALAGDKVFLISIKNTLLYTAGTLIPAMIIGFILAYLLQSKIFGIKFFRTCFYMPYITSMVSASMIWLWMYNPSAGIINHVLGWFNIQPKQWLFDYDLALGSLIIMGVWKLLGYNMVIFLSGLQNIPDYLYEAATIDGANTLQKIRHITLPMLRPVTFFLFVIGCIQNFRMFEQVNILTNGGPSNATTTIVHQIYTRGFQEFLMGYAAALSVVMLIIILILTLVNFKYGSEGQDLEA